jgi:glycosyltransferase involved in cell wall biosynthesis
MSLRILFMNDTPPDANSGAAGTELQTITALRKLGHHVDALWSDALPRHIRHGNLHYLLELPRTYLSAMQKQLALADYDVVHAGQPHGYLAAQELRRRGRSPIYVHRSHGFEPRIEKALARWQHLSPRRPLVRRMASALVSPLLEYNYRGVARHAHGHIVSSSLCADELRRSYGVNTSRIAVIGQAAPDMFRDVAAPPLDGDRLHRLLHVGQYAFFKAPMILARAFELVLEELPNATLTWVCAAAHHEQARALFRSETRERVRLVNWMPQDQLLRVYDAHGGFLFPSFAEGFGKALLEAMTRGLAVVASDEGCAHDLIRPGEDGERVPVGDAAAMAQAALRIAADPVRAARMGERARETGVACSWERTARGTADFYQQLIEMQ